MQHNMTDMPSLFVVGCIASSCKHLICTKTSQQAQVQLESLLWVCWAVIACLASQRLQCLLRNSLYAWIFLHMSTFYYQACFSPNCATKHHCLSQQLFLRFILDSYLPGAAISCKAHKTLSASLQALNTSSCLHDPTCDFMRQEILTVFSPQARMPARFDFSLDFYLLVVFSKKWQKTFYKVSARSASVKPSR